MENNVVGISPRRIYLILVLHVDVPQVISKESEVAADVETMASMGLLSFDAKTTYGTITRLTTLGRFRLCVLLGSVADTLVFGKKKREKLTEPAAAARSERSRQAGARRRATHVA